MTICPSCLAGWITSNRFDRNDGTIPPEPFYFLEIEHWNENTIQFDMSLLVKLLGTITGEPAPVTKSGTKGGSKTGLEFEKIVETALDKDFEKAADEFAVYKKARRVETALENIPCDTQKPMYERNPLGSQHFPDFVVAIDGRYFEIECKSSASSNKPVWNGGLPRPERGVFYLLKFPKISSRSVAVAKGDRMMTKEIYEFLKSDEYVQMAGEFSDRVNAKLRSAGTADINWAFYMRAMFSQSFPVDAIFAAREECLADVVSDIRGAGGPSGADRPPAGGSRSPAEFTPPYSAETRSFMNKYNKPQRAKLGQYFTPANIKSDIFEYVRQKLPEWLDETAPDGKALEPSAGTGELIELILRMGFKPDNVTAYEIEPELRALLATKFGGTVIRGDFLDGTDPGDKYSLVLSNPPYVDLKGYVGGDIYREKYPEWLSSRTNIFVAFVGKSLEMLEEGGVGIFIVPTSIKYGPMTRPVRDYVAKNCEVLFINEAGKFSEDANQDVIVIVVRKRKGADAGADADAPSRYVFNTGLDVILSSKPEVIGLAKNRPKISDLSMKISNGAVVWNNPNVRKLLTNDPERGTTFLLYQGNIPKTGTALNFPIQLARKNSADKAQWMTSAAGKKLVTPPFIALTRVGGSSSNFVLRSVVVKSDDPAVSGKQVLAENHVIVIEGTPENLEKINASFRRPEMIKFIQEVAGSLTISISVIKILPVF